MRVADFFPDWNTAWVAGDFVRACAWVSGVLEYGGAAAGIFAYAVQMASVFVSAGNRFAVCRNGSCGVGDYADTCGFCVFYGAGLFGAGNCVFGYEGIVCIGNKE